MTLTWCKRHVRHVQAERHAEVAAWLRSRGHPDDTVEQFLARMQQTGFLFRYGLDRVRAATMAANDAALRDVLGMSAEQVRLPVRWQPYGWFLAVVHERSCSCHVPCCVGSRSRLINEQNVRIHERCAE